MDLFLLVVLKPDLWGPVDTHDMGPVLSAIPCDTFDGSVDIRAQEALDISASLSLMIS